MRVQKDWVYELSNFITKENNFAASCSICTNFNKLESVIMLMVCVWCVHNNK